MLPEPKYWGGQWHYDDASISTQIIEHALRFALDDYERANATGRYPAHPYTQGPAAIKDALAEIDSWRLRAQRILAEARSV